MEDGDGRRRRRTEDGGRKELIGCGGMFFLKTACGVI